MVHLLIICVGQIVTSSPNVTLLSKYFSLNVLMCSALFIFGRYAEGYPWNQFSVVYCTQMALMVMATVVRVRGK